MSPEKTLLTEIAEESTAILQARSEPIPQEMIDRSMNFIRNFILGIPAQELRETEAPANEPLPENNGDLDDVTRLAGIKK